MIKSRKAKFEFRLAHLIAVFTLALVWVMLWGSLSWGTVVLAVVVSALALVLFPLPLPRARLRIRPVACVVVLLRFLAELVVASFAVGWLAIRPRPISKGRVLDVPLISRNDLCSTIVSAITSLVPGTVVIDMDARTRVLTMHVLDACDDERATRETAAVQSLERRVAWALGLTLEERR